MTSAAPRMIPPFKSGITVGGSDLSAPAAFTLSDIAHGSERIHGEQIVVASEPVGAYADSVEHIRQSRLRLWQTQQAR